MLPSLTIGIPTLGRESVLIDTLNNVLANRPREVEVLVVDQTLRHEPATERQLGEWFQKGEIRWLKHQPPSLTGARNRILEEARGEVVLFLDDDVRIPCQLIQEHLRLYADASVAAVTGQVWNCENPDRVPPLDRPERGTRAHSDVRVLGDARNISGGNHSVRRAVALGIGGYDPAFLGSALGEDLDFSQRLLLAGHRIVYNPRAWIIHLGVKSGGCGVGKGSPWPEWQYSAGLLLYAFRHARRQKNVREIVWMALRNGPLRKEAICSPLRWPVAAWGFLRAILYAWRHRAFTSERGAHD